MCEIPLNVLLADHVSLKRIRCDTQARLAQHQERLMRRKRQSGKAGATRPCVWRRQGNTCRHFRPAPGRILLNSAFTPMSSPSANPPFAFRRRPGHPGRRHSSLPSPCCSFARAGLLTGGTVGIAFLIHYLSGWPMGRWFSASICLSISSPCASWGGFHRQDLRRGEPSGGSHRSGAAPLSTSNRVDRTFAAVMGLFIGVGLLMLIRHKSSVGGLGVVAIYLQNTRGWRAGKVQMAADVLILGRRC